MTIPLQNAVSGIVFGAFLMVAGCGVELPVAPSSPQNVARPGSPPAPEARTTGGFDGERAYRHVEKLVSFGPRRPASDAMRQAQAYIQAQLESAGCKVEEDDFSAPTPAGRVAMKNIVAKAAGEKSDVLLFLTHYDTAPYEDFVGANDGGSSSAVMLELARHVCARKNALNVWIAFLDGEEAQVQWSETDSLYGSRRMAARLANSGELKRIRAVVLADMVGYRDLRFRREMNSTPWLNELIWSTAARLGYANHFAAGQTTVEDDHLPFLRRGIPAADIIQLEDFPYWHTPGDTLDKISPRSLAIVGHVLLELLPALENKFRK